MARKSPPQHRIDVSGVFIPRNDSSFDEDRYQKEIKEMQEKDISISEHPVSKYYSGKTRYDLQAIDSLFDKPVKVSEYFKNDEMPERWILKRLAWDQWHKVMTLVESGNISEAELLAARYGICEVQNSTLKLDSLSSGFMSHADMQKIHETDAGLPLALGFAVWMYSRPLTDIEKKV